MPIPKRRMLLVDRAVQWAIVWQSLRHWFFHSLATAAFLALLQTLLGGVFKPWSEQWQAIWPMAVSVYVAMIVLLPKYIHDSLKLSNRFAGPVSRMRRVLRDVAAGKPFTPLKFREGDFWMGMADELNAAVETLSRQSKPDQPASCDRPAAEEALETSLL